MPNELKLPIEHLAVGLMVKRTGWVLARHALPIFGLSLLASWSENVISGQLRHNLLGGPLPNPLIFLCKRLPECLLLIAITCGSRRALESGQFEFRSSLAGGLTTVLNVVGASIALSIMSFIGFVCFVVPGLFIAVAWGFAPTMCVLERSKVTRSFQRSAELTRGNRWRVLAINLMLYALLILSFFLQRSFIRADLVTLWPMLARAMVDPISFVLSTVVALELLRLKEGAIPRAITAVF